METQVQLQQRMLCVRAPGTWPQNRPYCSWNQAVSRARKLVAYPTSSLGLKHLQSDDMSSLVGRPVPSDDTIPFLRTLR